jgi:hypothetical protein
MDPTASMDLLTRDCYVDFGDEPSSLTPTIMDGFGRLKSLGINNCRGDTMLFAELAPIQNLSKFSLDLGKNPPRIEVGLSLQLRRNVAR